MNGQKYLTQNNYKIIDTVFDGMLFNINCPPNELHGLFNEFKHITVNIQKGEYQLNYLNSVIAKIKDTEFDRLMLTPGNYIHRKKKVFKTYNRLLRTFTDGYFLKFLSNKWTLCKEIKK